MGETKNHHLQWRWSHYVHISSHDFENLFTNAKNIFFNFIHNPQLKQCSIFFKNIMLSKNLATQKIILNFKKRFFKYIVIFCFTRHFILQNSLSYIMKKTQKHYCWTTYIRSFVNIFTYLETFLQSRTFFTIYKHFLKFQTMFYITNCFQVFSCELANNSFFEFSNIF